MVGPLATLPVIQLGFVVRDIEAATARFGGEWTQFQSEPRFYRDVRAARGDVILDHRVALRDGSPQIELIQPVSPGNVWHEWLTAHGEGLDHVAVGCDSPFDAIADMERAGFPLLLAGRLGGGEFAYFDTVAACGVHVEALRLPRSLAT